MKTVRWTAARSSWRAAYGYARCLMLGTLWTTFDQRIARLAVDAMDFTRREPMLPAYRFKALGYYRIGKRI